MKIMSFLVRVVVTVIVAFPVVYLSWDVVRATTADDIMLAVLIIDVYGLMLTLLFCLVNALTKLLQHDNESS